MTGIWNDPYSLTRYEWGANPITCTAGRYLDPFAFTGLVIHHDVIPAAATDDPDLVAVHARRVQKARPDLPGNIDGTPEWPYSFGIAEHPNPHRAWIIEGRGICRSGAHTAGFNFARYGIVLFGDWTGREITPGMVDAIRRLAADLEEQGHWFTEPTVGHRASYATGCPGIPDHQITSSLQPPFTTTEDTMTDDQLTELTNRLDGANLRMDVIAHDQRELTNRIDGTNARLDVIADLLRGLQR